jgi:Arc/MetJ-type ribon-helix-helix transcriptional regulator
MALTLTPEQEELVESTVRAGRFASKEEAVRSAFATLDPLAGKSQAERARIEVIRSTNLADLLSEYPWAGAELEIERDRTPLRDLDL